MTSTSADLHESLQRLLGQLRSARVVYFPIRHHSPACAAHLHAWILQHRPAAVLVEGPASFSTHIPFLLDARCQCPVAIYTHFVDQKGRLSKSTESPDASRLPAEAARFGAYYPFCDYSPELVALRAGHAVGASLRFIDLEYAEMVLAQHHLESRDDEPVLPLSLGDDVHLRQSQYMKELARRMGCRDFNELWDHLFESSWTTLSTDAFIDRLAGYCFLARHDYSAERLQRDGTAAREACMASLIQEELDRLRASDPALVRPVLVVTGGFHTVALPDLVAQKVSRPAAVAFADSEVGSWLLRYSSNQLDALAGYAAGMPCPGFYDRLWQAGQMTPGADAADSPVHVRLERVAAEMLVEIGRQIRDRQLAMVVSTADVLAALEMTKNLATLRGHRWPQREDLLDGIRACFVKGEMHAEGQVILGIVFDLLAGTQIGKLPPGTGVPAIVIDFQQQAARLRLLNDTHARRELTLDLYRKASHREISRLLHRLDFLQVPFARFVAGPDFVTGAGLERMQEHWQIAWSPATDSSLVEASTLGPTVLDACATRLHQHLNAMEKAGQGRSAAIAVQTLVRACRLGLHEHVGRIVPLIDTWLAEDPSLASVVNGLSQLELLLHAREPLEAPQIDALPGLIQAAYHRACRLLLDIATCPDEVVEEILDSLRLLREILAGDRGKATVELDAELFRQALRRILDHPPSKPQPAMVGAAAGILHGDGYLEDRELIRAVLGFLAGAVGDPRVTSGVLRGLLSASREILWQVTELVQAIDGHIGAWDEAAFLETLPDLRLAFTELTPREVVRVADQVATLHGEPHLGELVHMDLDEGEVRLALEVTQRVREVLRGDGL